MAEQKDSTNDALILTDENCLLQILNNLISNSLKFTQSGQVTVSTQRVAIDADTIEETFEIVDSGIGISPDFSGHVFEKFSQGDYATRFGGGMFGFIPSFSIRCLFVCLFVYSLLSSPPLLSYLLLLFNRRGTWASNM